MFRKDSWYRGALLSVLFFGGLVLLASVPVSAQGGGETEEDDDCEVNTICEEITVTGQNPPANPGGGTTGPPPPPNTTTNTDPPTPPPNPCLECHTPHTPQPPKPPPPPAKNCSAQVMALNAADDMVDRRCHFLSWWSQDCRAARAARDIALKDLAACQGPGIR